MDDYVFMKKSLEVEKLATEMGFIKAHFLDDDFVLLKSVFSTGGKSRVKGNSFPFDSRIKKDLLKEVQLAKQRKQKTIFRADSEDMLRFALEKADVDMIYGMENIHPKDSTHYVRGGLDQVLCTIAAEKGKVLVFSFAELLNSSGRGKLLARLMFNLKLCRKYKVKTALCSFASSKEEMRSAKDLQALGRVLGF